jgi:hypothetical protein
MLSQPFMIAGQSSGIKADLSRRPCKPAPRQTVRRLIIEESANLPEVPRGPCQRGGGAWAQLILDQGNQTVPDDVARSSEIPVGGIVDPPHADLHQIAVEQGAGDVQQGAEEPATPGRHPTEAVYPGAADKVQQNGLRLIVPLMGQQNPTAVGLPRKAPQGPISQPA